MTIAEVKERLDLLLNGDNGEYVLNEAVLDMALKAVLSRTKPRTHIVLETSTLKHLFKYYRRISISDRGRFGDKKVAYWLRYPFVDISDNANLDMEEELAQAVIYFLCSFLSKKAKAEFEKRAENEIAIYDTNIEFRKTPRFLNAYFYIKGDNSGSGGNSGDSGGGSGGGSDQPSVIPVLRNIVIEVGESVEILVDNADGGAITATSDTTALEVSVNGNIVTITAMDEIEQGFVTIKGGDENFRIEIYATEGDGGFI